MKFVLRHTSVVFKSSVRTCSAGMRVYGMMTVSCLFFSPTQYLFRISQLGAPILQHRLFLTYFTHKASCNRGQPSKSNNFPGAPLCVLLGVWFLFGNGMLNRNTITKRHVLTPKFIKNGRVVYEKTVMTSQI